MVSIPLNEENKHNLLIGVIMVILAVLFLLYIIPSVGLQARKVRFRFCRGELRSPASPEKTGAFS